MITQPLNINNWRTNEAKSINLHIISKLIKNSLEKFRVKTVFTATVFEILLFEGRSVLGPAQRVPASERVRFPMKSQKMIALHWNCLKNDFLTSLGTFEWFLIFLTLFNRFSAGKEKKLDF